MKTPRLERNIYLNANVPIVNFYDVSILCENVFFIEEKIFKSQFQSILKLM